MDQVKPSVGSLSAFNQLPMVDQVVFLLFAFCLPICETIQMCVTRVSMRTAGSRRCHTRSVGLQVGPIRELSCRHPHEAIVAQAEKNMC